MFWKWSMNMGKVLQGRFQHCFRTFTMFLVKGFSQTWLFRHFSEYVFGVRNLEITKSITINFFLSKCSKVHLDFRNAVKNREKVLCFWDNCISIDMVKLSLLRRGYFSSAAKMLTNSPKIWPVNNREFFQLNCLGNSQWIW